MSLAVDWESKLPSISHQSTRLNDEHIAACDRATVLMGRDPAWEEWLDSAGLNAPEAFVYLEVDDHDKPYRMIRGADLTYKIGVDRILAAERAGRLVAEWLTIFGKMFDYWCERKGTAPHPPLPDPDATLPPEVEANLVSARMDRVLEIADEDTLDDILDEAD